MGMPFCGPAKSEGCPGLGFRFLRAGCDLGWRRFAIPKSERHGLLPIADRHFNCALGTHDDFAEFGACGTEHGQVGIRRDGAVRQLAALGVAVNKLDVVVDVAAIVPVIETAETHHKFGARSEVPVGHIDLVRSQFGREATGVFAKQTPVLGISLPARLHNPAGVAMPLRVNVRDITEHALVDHVLHRLIVLAVAALETHLESLLGVFSGERAEGMYLLSGEDEALFAEHLLARQLTNPS